MSEPTIKTDTVKCPHCKHEVSAGSKVCTHCGQDLASKVVSSEVVKPTPKVSSLERFEKFMATRSSSWILTNKTDTIAGYQKIVEARKGNCMIAGFLFLCGLVPGILYLYFYSRPASTYHLVVSMGSDGSLTATGDPEGIKIYSSFLQSFNTK